MNFYFAYISRVGRADPRVQSAQPTRGGYMHNTYPCSHFSTFFPKQRALFSNETTSLFVCLNRRTSRSYLTANLHCHGMKASSARQPPKLQHVHGKGRQKAGATKHIQMIEQEKTRRLRLKIVWRSHHGSPLSITNYQNPK